MDHLSFAENFLRSGLNAPKVIDLLDIHPKTFSRWMKSNAPRSAVRALQWYAGLHPDWLGFCFRGKEILTPAGFSVHKHQIGAFEWGMKIQYRCGWNDAEKHFKREAIGNVVSFPRFSAAVDPRR